MPILNTPQDIVFSNVEFFLGKTVLSDFSITILIVISLMKSLISSNKNP